MINNLIQAYRAQFYDFSLTHWWKIITTKKKTVLLPILLLIIISGLVLGFVYLHFPILIYSALFLEFVVCIIADRYFVKKYQKLLQNRALHLDEIKLFLDSIYPEHSLFSNATIDKLIERLSEYVLAHQPFKSFVGRLANFVKTIVIPAITFIAGLFTSEMQTLGFANIVVSAFAIVAILALFYIFWIFVSSALRKIIFRDYDAAIALLEDLQDIKLLYFSQENNTSCT